MNVSTLRSTVYRDLAEASIGNDRVLPADILEALNQAYERIASEVQCFVREQALVSVSGTMFYQLPDDMFGIRSIRYHTGTTPLVPTTTNKMAALSPSWRDVADGTPLYYFLNDARKIGLYPAPSVSSQVINVEGYVIPTTLITTTVATTRRERTSNIATLTTAAHGLTNGRPVTITGMTDTTFNAVNAIVTVTGATTFTYASVGSNVSDGADTGGTVAMTTPSGGVSLLVNDSDVPAFPANFHKLLVHDAVYTLCTRYLLDGEGAIAKAQAAKADFEQLLARFATYYATGVSLAPVPAAKG